jgi:DNA-directed RNA polymerase subunit RPC12/RpoP
MYVTCAGCGKKSHISTWVTIKKSSGSEATMSCPHCGRKVTIRV